MAPFERTGLGRARAPDHDLPRAPPEDVHRPHRQATSWRPPPRGASRAERQAYIHHPLARRPGSSPTWASTRRPWPRPCSTTRWRTRASPSTAGRALRRRRRPDRRRGRKLDRVQFDSKAAQQAASIRKMLVAMAKDLQVLSKSKLADRLHSMRTLGAMAPTSRRASPADPRVCA
ncbi:MAG: HD domain-containing protein [Acidimicrobiales bacterium]